MRPLKPIIILLGLLLMVTVPIAMVTVPIACRYAGQEVRSVLEPRDRAIDRQVFEQSPSFVHGKAQHISRLKLQYETAQGDHKQALRELILMEAAAVDNTLLPVDLQSFLVTL